MFAAGVAAFTPGETGDRRRLRTAIELVARISVPGQGPAIVMVSGQFGYDIEEQVAVAQLADAAATDQDRAPLEAKATVPDRGPWSAGLWLDPEEGSPTLVAVGMPPPGKPKGSLDLTVLVGNDRVTGTGPVTVVTAKQVPALADRSKPPAAVVVGRAQDGSVVPYQGDH